jgi:hypothetical protein
MTLRQLRVLSYLSPFEIGDFVEFRTLWRRGAPPPGSPQQTYDLRLDVLSANASKSEARSAGLEPATF